MHRRCRDPLLDYRCNGCGRVFNAWTGTPLQKTHRPASQLLFILHGMARGVPRARMARELGCQRAQLLYLCRRLHRLARPLAADTAPAPALAAAADNEPRAGDWQGSVPRARAS